MTLLGFCDMAVNVALIPPTTAINQIGFVDGHVLDLTLETQWLVGKFHMLLRSVDPVLVLLLLRLQVGPEPVTKS